MGGHMSCYGWAWVCIGRCWWMWSGYGYKFKGNVGLYFRLCLRAQRSMWMQDVCIVYMASSMASNESCVMVTWTIFKKYLLEVGLTKKWETMALRMLTTVDLFHFYRRWGPAWIESYWKAFGWGGRHTWLHTTLEYPWPHYMILEVSWDGLRTLSFGPSQYHGSWHICEVALSNFFWSQSGICHKALDVNL